MTEKEMYNLINNQNNQQSNGFAVNEKERGISGVFSALMRKVYTWMTLALLITGVTAYGVASSPTLLMTLMTSRGLLFGLIIAELALVFIISGALQRLSLTTATLLFIVYSVLNGAMLSSVFVVYTMTSIAKVFLLQLSTFGAMAFYGYTTKKDLTSLGKILFMALIGLIIATIVNMFLKSSGFDYILSYAKRSHLHWLDRLGQSENQADAPDTIRHERGRTETGTHRSLDPVSRFYQSLPLLAPHLRRQQQGIMKTRTGNKVKNKE